MIQSVHKEIFQNMSRLYLLQNSRQLPRPRQRQEEVYGK